LGGWGLVPSAPPDAIRNCRDESARLVLGAAQNSVYWRNATVPEREPLTVGDPAARWDRDPSTLREESWSGLSAQVAADMDVSRAKCVGDGANA
jgi:hypothetical protein